MSTHRHQIVLGEKMPVTPRRDFGSWIGTILSGLMLAMLLVDPASARTLGAQARLYNTSSQQVGTARLIQLGNDGVLIQVNVRSLLPGFHGFHVHAVGDCTPASSFASAGPHYDPRNNLNHGDHLGDLPVLLVNEDGTANAIFNTERFALADLFDGDGSAIVIHANPDNYANIPAERYAAIASGTKTRDAATLSAGDSGARIVCGVVEKLLER
jgi:superoxide dismutase, Cu-Zn family